MEGHCGAIRIHNRLTSHLLSLRYSGRHCLAGAAGSSGAPEDREGTATLCHLLGSRKAEAQSRVAKRSGTYN